LWLAGEALASFAFSSAELQLAFQFGEKGMQRVVTVAPAAEAPARNGMPLPTEGALETGTPAAIRILFVEDDDYYREVLERELVEHGFAIRSFADAASLLGSIELAVDADVILLDWALPRTSGIDLLPQLRRRGVNLPVVFLTGHALTVNESLAFDCGAIDFIDKARGVEVVVRRLKRVVETARSAAPPDSEKLLVRGKLVLKQSISRATWGDVDVGLTVGEYHIVHLLASNVGRYVTYRAVYDCMHYVGFIAGSGDHGYRANVRSAIKRIRNKFRELDPTFDEIENYTGFGYCWGKANNTA
jgi:two-component system, OmpR family, response regulator ChvI